MSLHHRGCGGTIAYDNGLPIREDVTPDDLVLIPAGYEWIPGLVCLECSDPIKGNPHSVAHFRPRDEYNTQLRLGT